MFYYYSKLKVTKVPLQNHIFTHNVRAWLLFSVRHVYPNKSNTIIIRFKLFAVPCVDVLQIERLVSVRYPYKYNDHGYIYYASTNGGDDQLQISDI